MFLTVRSSWTNMSASTKQPDPAPSMLAVVLAALYHLGRIQIKDNQR